MPKIRTFGAALLALGLAGCVGCKEPEGPIPNDPASSAWRYGDAQIPPDRDMFGNRRSDYANPDDSGCRR